MNEISITGGCLCGAVRYNVSAPPLLARMCYCRVCQYFACGNAAVNVAFPSSAVSFTGSIKDYVSIADSGTEMRRRFCPECGVHIASGAVTRPEVVILRVGTLDDPDLVTPTKAIWVDSAPRWACIDPAMEQVAGQPMPAKPAT